jgi:type IV pilus assembly protein PilA
MKKMNNKGFSLVELIIVIAIMAILIAVLAPQYLKYVEKSRESADLDNWQAILSATQVAYADVDDPVTVTATVKCTGKNSAIQADPALASAFASLGTDVANMKMKSTKFSNASLTATVNASTGLVTITCSNSDLQASLGLKN